MAKKSEKPAARPRGGRSLFEGKPKDSDHRVQGYLTDDGMTAFEAKRARLAGLLDLKPEQISDGDAIEALARGEMQTLRYLGRRRR
jgi:hypothetical protein